MSHKILIADDNPAVRETLSAYLGDALGYDVTAVEDGHAALDAAIDNNFDLCILDVKMPGFSGAEVYTRLRNLQPHTEAIFFTADQDFEASMDFLRFALPPERVLKKPLEDFSDLTRLIISILGPPIA